MGPLKGLRVLEMAGLAPGPYCAMLLADLGAGIIRIERPGGTRPGASDRLSLLNRNRQTVVIDLKSPHGVAVVARLAGKADALIEGFRPGVMERLGLGPDVCLTANRKLVYGRMTRAEWCALLEGSETCFAPVLSIPEAMAHPHNRARKAFTEVDGVTQPSPAPRFSRSQPEATRLPDVPGTDTESLLAVWGFSGAEVAELRRQGAFG